MTRLIVGAALSLATVAVVADEVKTDQASEGSLEAHLIVTNEGSDLLEKWRTGIGRISLRSIDTVERGEFVTVVVRFGGCMPDDAGLCNATVSYTAYRPDGSIYGEFRDAELWVEKPAPSEGASQMAVEYLGLVFEPDDPDGEYRLVAEVRDHVAESAVELSRELVVSP